MDAITVLTGFSNCAGQFSAETVNILKLKTKQTSANTPCAVDVLQLFIL